jgi:hypothetical protein
MGAIKHPQLQVSPHCQVSYHKSAINPIKSPCVLAQSPFSHGKSGKAKSPWPFTKRPSKQLGNAPNLHAAPWVFGLGKSRVRLNPLGPGKVPWRCFTVSVEVPTGWCPSSLVKLVYNFNFTMVYGRYIYTFMGVINQFITFGGPTW